MMTRPLLIAAVALAAYAVVSSGAALTVAALWRRQWLDRAPLPASARARRLAALRLAPAAAGMLSLAVVLPVFIAFEPVREYEAVGPLLLALAALGAAVTVAALVVAARTALVTSRIQRQWLRSAAVLEFDPPAGVPAYVIDTLAPIVALVGVFSPRLVAARSIVQACSRDELAAIVAHERGHLHARDNLKRWLLSCSPDVLRWSPVHRQIVAAWRDAAEDAADDEATRHDERARLDLAALLVKVARLAPGMTTPAAVSTFADLDGLDRRVRRLLSASTPEPASSWPGLTAALVAVALLAGVATALEPSILHPVYEAIELTVRFGR